MIKLILMMAGALAFPILLGILENRDDGKAEIRRMADSDRKKQAMSQPNRRLRYMEKSPQAWQCLRGHGK